jgi:hypothetical protein
MVKLNGPMFSIDASGKLADAIVFSKWKGRNYARSLVTPSNPQSGGQVGMRRMLRFLSQDWTNLGAGQQNSWDDRADDAVISNFNAYIGFNLARWRNFSPPSATPTLDPASTPATLANEAATAGVRQVTIDFDVTLVVQNWGVAIFRSTTLGFSTAFTNLVQAIPATAVASYSWVDTPLAAGTYYYNFRAFTMNGVFGAETGEVNATVT